jgi:cation transport ATPase
MASAMRSAPSLARYATEPSRAIGERDLALTGAAVFAGVLAATLVLAGESPLVFGVRCGIAAVGFVVLVVRRFRGATDPLEMHPLALLVPPAAAIAIAAWSWLVRDGSRAEATTFAGLLVAASSLAVHVVDRLRRTGSSEADLDEVAALDRTRIDVSSGIARAARRVAELGGLGGAALAALAAFSNSEPTVRVVLAACAGYLAFATAAVSTIASICIGRAVREATGRAIGYRSAADWDRASEVGIAALSARGTLLLGEPELVDVEVVGPIDSARVLSLVAGAEGADRHPVAVAIQRAATSRRIEADAVRSPSVQPGLGVTAVASTGETLIVGSRTLMLREKISVAMMEREIAELEARGRTVLLVALGGRVVGLIGLQDGLRPRARAAVQHLLDAQVEPVLLSGDSRETCEVIAQALDIDHVRPEVLPADRPREVQRLAEGGVTVAVFGRAVIDDPALAAAHVGVALARPEGTVAKWPISLPTDDLRDAAEAVALARKARLQARTGTALAIAPGLLAVLVVAFAVASPGWVPVGAAFGALLSGLYVRAGDIARTRSEIVASDPLA